MKRISLLILIAGMITRLDAQTPTVQRLPLSNATGSAAAVRVADGALVFTGQVSAPASDAAGRSGDAGEEAEAALRALDAVLAQHGSDLARVVRLNAYVADDAAMSAVDAAVAKNFAQAPVALTVVRTPLAGQGARVAFEAVAAAASAPAKVAVGKTAAVMPAGGKIFISGQAEKGKDLAEAVRLTMAGLHRSVAHLGLTKADVVQVKAFIRPFGEHAAAAREVAASFDGGPVPPVVMMEWQSELFAEIELVVAAKTLAAPVAGETVSHAWLPWLTKSPRYSSVAQVTAGTPLIFIGAVDGGETGDARAQMKTIFERLGSGLFEAGSSYRHLAKASYYLGDAKARVILGEIRGVYFDPARPPAASALGVAGFGRAGRTAMVDMIAVPVAGERK